MKYFYVKPENYIRLYGKDISVNHPLIRSGTLFTEGGRGFIVVQQRFEKLSKSFYWSSIDDYLCNDIYLNPNFPKIFREIAKGQTDELYPIITVRRLMWALRMKPLRKEYYEEDLK